MLCDAIAGLPIVKDHNRPAGTPERKSRAEAGRPSANDRYIIRLFHLIRFSCFMAFKLPSCILKSVWCRFLVGIYLPMTSRHRTR
jgi:hypothetical protein